MRAVFFVSVSSLFLKTQCLDLFLFSFVPGLVRSVVLVLILTASGVGDLDAGFLVNARARALPQHGHLETLRFLAGKAQTGGEEGGVGTCIGERLGCLMLHLAAEAGRECTIFFLLCFVCVWPSACTPGLIVAAEAKRRCFVSCCCAHCCFAVRVRVPQYGAFAAVLSRFEVCVSAGRAWVGVLLVGFTLFLFFVPLRTLANNVSPQAGRSCGGRIRQGDVGGVVRLRFWATEFTTASVAGN